MSPTISDYIVDYLRYLIICAGYHIDAKLVGGNGVFKCENTYVRHGKDKDEKQELQTRKCRLGQREHGRTGESGMNPRGVGGVDKAAGDRANEDLNETWMQKWGKTAHG